MKEVNISRIFLFLIIFFKNDELDFDIRFLFLREFILLKNIVYDLIFLVSFIMNDINNNNKISNNIINNNNSLLFINKNKSYLDNISIKFSKWRVTHNRRIILDCDNYPSFYLDYYDFHNRKDNEDKTLLRTILLPSASHYLYRELVIECDLGVESLVANNNFILNIIENIISNLIDIFHNNNDISD